ncbi:hypothetical protein EAO75_14090 [Streptomyces sp. uw30]|nr:hypothetical protein EAO75_14090 [Streptomyces sp. uw30]
MGRLTTAARSASHEPDAPVAAVGRIPSMPPTSEVLMVVARSAIRRGFADVPHSTQWRCP